MFLFTFSGDGSCCNASRQQRADEEGHQGADQGLDHTVHQDIDQQAGHQGHQGVVGLQVKQEQRDKVIGQAECGD